MLALLAVIVLPLTVRDSDAPHNVPDMEVSIPERSESEWPPALPENDSGSAKLDIEPDAGTPAVPAEIPEPPPLPVASEPTTPPVAPPVASVPPEQPASTPPAAKPPRESRRENPPTATSEEARALALLDGTASVKDRGGKTEAGQVFVQIGSYSKAANAARQAEELKKQGFAAYAEKAGKVTRVRIGPLPRSEGEQVVAQLKSQGRNAVLSSR